MWGYQEKENREKLHKEHPLARENGQSCTRKSLLLLFVLSFNNSLAGKWWHQPWKYNATFCSRGKAKKQTPKVASFIPTLETHFIALLDFVLPLWLPWHPREQMPRFHFEAEFSYRQNCFHLRIPSHPIRGLSEEHSFKMWMECIPVLRLELGMGVREYLHIFAFIFQSRKCKRKFL